VNQVILVVGALIYCNLIPDFALYEENVPSRTNISNLPPYDSMIVLFLSVCMICIKVEYSIGKKTIPYYMLIVYFTISPCSYDLS
jgi:hypothetical protein